MWEDCAKACEAGAKHKHIIWTGRVNGRDTMVPFSSGQVSYGGTCCTCGDRSQTAGNWDTERLVLPCSATVFRYRLSPGFHPQLHVKG